MKEGKGRTLYEAPRVECIWICTETVIAASSEISDDDGEWDVL